MKRLVMLILIWSMIGIPVNAVDREKVVSVSVTSKDSTPFIRALLKREISKLDGFRAVQHFPFGKVTDWQVHVVAIRHDDGMYVIAVGIAKKRYLVPYLKKSISSRQKDFLGNIPEYFNIIVHSGYDINELCTDIVILLEDMFSE